jgi:hypothetical protein
MHAINFQLLALVAVVFLTIFSGWEFSTTTTMSAWSGPVVEKPDNIVWD